jgi:Multicopper oxidase
MAQGQKVARVRSTPRPDSGRGGGGVAGGGTTPPSNTGPYPQGTGVPGPGEFAGGPVDWTLTGVNGDNFQTFGCNVFTTDPNTPDWMTADVYFERKVFSEDFVPMFDGNLVKFWGWEDTLKAPGVKKVPGPTIRLKENQLAHVKMSTSVHSHTIHHHGIEPSTMNDGVGHVSFETTAHYIYQWKPRSPGTWFYHCHRNTVLHFEMGLFGLLIVDPQDGWGHVHSGATKYKYDVEAFWVFDDIDPIWHNTLNHHAGLCGEDVGLNIFKPRYFHISGVDRSQTAALDSPVRVKATKGQRVLIRMLNASYSMLRIKINGLEYECVSMDGHCFIDAKKPWLGAYPYHIGEEILLATAQRFELWLDTTDIAVGTYQVDFEFLDWIKKTPHNNGDPNYQGKATTFIDIT